jgi:hypothetical protein
VKYEGPKPKDRVLSTQALGLSARTKCMDHVDAAWTATSRMVTGLVQAVHVVLVNIKFIYIGGPMPSRVLIPCFLQSR